MSRPRRPGDRDPFAHEWRELLALFPHFSHVTCNPYTDMSQSDMDMQAPQPWFRHAVLNNSMRPIQYVELRLKKDDEVVGYTVVDTHTPEFESVTAFEVVGYDPHTGELIRFAQKEVMKTEFDSYARSLKLAPVFNVYERVVEEHFCCGVKFHIPEGVLKRTPSVEMRSLRYKEEGRIRKIRRRIRHLFQRFR